MKHPSTRAERLALRRRYSGEVFAERWLRYKYAYRNKFGAPWEDRVRRDEIRKKSLTRDDDLDLSLTITYNNRMATEPAIETPEFSLPILTLEIREGEQEAFGAALYELGKAAGKQRPASGFFETLYALRNDSGELAFFTRPAVTPMFTVAIIAVHHADGKAFYSQSATVEFRHWAEPFIRRGFEEGITARKRAAIESQRFDELSHEFALIKSTSEWSDAAYFLVRDDAEEWAKLLVGDRPLRWAVTPVEKGDGYPLVDETIAALAERHGVEPLHLWRAWVSKKGETAS